MVMRGSADRILALDIHGRVVCALRNASSADLGKGQLAHGVYVVKIEKNGVAAVRRIPKVDE
jgi:hypothetical protein